MGNIQPSIKWILHEWFHLNHYTKLNTTISLKQLKELFNEFCYEFKISRKNNALLKQTLIDVATNHTNKYSFSNKINTNATSFHELVHSYNDDSIFSLSDVLKLIPYSIKSFKNNRKKMAQLSSSLQS